MPSLVPTSVSVAISSDLILHPPGHDVTSQSAGPTDSVENIMGTGQPQPLLASHSEVEPRVSDSDVSLVITNQEVLAS